MFALAELSMKALAIIALISLSGCGSDKQRFPIEGEITFNGQAVKEGSIQFHPLAPSEGFLEGAIIQAGRYKIPADKGLLAGKYQVLISSPDYKGKKPDPNEAPGAVYQARELLPEIYNTKSTLTVEVLPKWPNNFDFHLK
jgi:hypothetical protein